jgi:hypothetical protein
MVERLSAWQSPTYLGEFSNWYIADVYCCVCFVAPSRAAVAAFHAAALAAAGKDEGPLGPSAFWPDAYAGYVRDLDGNKLAVYCLKAK